MIEAHTVDAWTRAASKTTVAFRNATILGGFAAPAFLWLAGLSVALAASGRYARTGDRRDAVSAVCRRGLEIFVLAFLFRIQAFVVSPGSPPIALFRVDILNVMGPSIVLAGVLWGCTTNVRARVAVCAAAAAAIAMATPIVRESPVIDRLPIWIQWHLRPAGEQTMFTLFPWAGFVFAGGAVGSLIAGMPRERERDLQGALAVAGAVLVALGFYTATLPSIYRSSSFWTSSPTWFAIRTGVLMVGLSAIFLLAEAATRLNRSIAPLERMGRSSLFVYWIHVDLVYGYATWPIHGVLPLWASAAAWGAFSAAMYGAIVVRDELVRRWRARRGTGAPQIATA